MSETQEKQLSEKLDVVSKLVTVGRYLLGGAAIIGGWVATLEYRHRQIDKLTAETEIHVTEISLWKERTEANRFDSKAGVELSNAFNARANAQDMRMQKIESGQDEMKRILERIEKKIDTH